MICVPNKDFGHLAKLDEGLVFLGCQDPEEWVEGLNKLWIQDGVVDPTWFDAPFVITTTGGRRDIVFPFSAVYHHQPAQKVATLAMWRLRFGDCSWISDYRVNYRDQHHVTVEPTVEPTPHVRKRPIARMAPMGSRDMVKVKKTAGKKTPSVRRTQLPGPVAPIATRRSTRKRTIPARFRQ